MSEPAYPGLEVEAEPDYLRRAARVQAGTRLAIALALGLAALGACGGGGPLARATVADGPLVARFDRFARLDAPLRIELALPPGAGAVELDAGYAGALAIERVTPTPSAERATPGGVRFEVDGDRVVFRVRPDRFGRVGGRVASGGRSVVLWHLVYP